MATTLVYTISPYVPFTKILSSSANQDKTDIRSRLNWAGGTDATTGLGDDNLQSNTASGGGLTRSSKLKAGTANYVVINDGTGKMSEEQYLSISRGGLGTTLPLTNPGDVIQVNAAGTAYTTGVSPVPPALRVITYLRNA